MRTKKVNRYWCDFCNKAGLSAGHMRSHEKHCTLNPNRECRVCKMLKEKSRPLPELIALLPVPTIVEDEFGCRNFQDGFEASVNDALPALRNACGDCPVCIMAALRQAKIPVPVASAFDFTKEMKSVWEVVNEAQRDRFYAHG